MQQKLTKPEKQKLRKHFGEEQKHPLFVACDNVFNARAARLQGVKADGEDVFREVAALLDFLKEAPERSLRQQDVNELYTRVVNDVRDWEQSTPRDREIIADTVFRIVRKLMCHYWPLWHSEQVFRMMGVTLEHEARKLDSEDVQELDDRLSEFSVTLDAWVNQDYEGQLSDEIKEVVEGKVIPLKKKSGRKAVDPKNITASFNYLPRQSDKAQRLQAFFESLKRGFIDTKTDMRTFINLFTGASMTDYIVWTRSVRELHYMIDSLVDKKWISVPGYGKWQVVCARFRIRTKKKETIDDSMTDDSYVVEPLSPTQFSKDSGVPKTHEELDKALRILDPETDYTEALQDFIDEQERERSDIEDYKDVLAHGLQISSRG